jgi:hypothetical protein
VQTPTRLLAASLAVDAKYIHDIMPVMLWALEPPDQRQLGGLWADPPLRQFCVPRAAIGDMSNTAKPFHVTRATPTLRN